MDQENGQPQEQNGDNTSSGDHLPVPIIDAAKSDKCGPKGTEHGDNPTTLHNVARWDRFRKWCLTATIAEVGMFLLTLAIAASSIYYTKYAKRQWKVMSDQLPELQTSAKAAKDAATAAQAQASISEEALHSVQRAFVIFSPDPEVTGINDGGKIATWLMRVPMENTGVTPTRGLRDRISWIDPVYPLPESYAYPDRPPPHGQNEPTAVSTVAPKQRIFGPNMLIDPDIITDFVAQNHPALNRQALSRAMSQRGVRKKRLYLYGWARYHDIFKDTPERLTEFCYVLQMFQLPSQAQAGGAQWAYCTHHNCIDEECPDYGAKIKQER